jgi:hypothetical protein
MTFTNTIHQFSSSNFSANISRLPDFKYRIQKVVLPDIAISSTQLPTPFKQVDIPGDTINYGSLSIDFVLSESLDTYVEIVNWMKGLTAGDGFERFQKISLSSEGLISDITINLYSNNNLPQYEYLCHDCFPISLSTPTLDASSTDDDTNIISVVFALSSFDINKI